MSPKRHAFCSFCGARYSSDAWPRSCGSCKATIWENPIPVSVIVQPVKDASGYSVLLVRRAIPPKIGELALPGGYVDRKESGAEAACRELREECGIICKRPEDLSFFGERIDRDKNLLLLFWVAPTIDLSALPTLSPNDEVSELVVTEKSMELAFPYHTDALHRYLG